MKRNKRKDGQALASKEKREERKAIQIKKKKSTPKTKEEELVLALDRRGTKNGGRGRSILELVRYRNHIENAT